MIQKPESYIRDLVKKRCVSLPVLKIHDMKLNIYRTLHRRTGLRKEDVEIVKFLETASSYDQYQNLIKEVNYSSDGELNTYTNYQYDEQRKLLVSAMYDGENVLCQKSEYSYDNNMLVKQNDFFGEEAMEYTTVFVYENNLIIREEAYEDDEFLSIQKEYFYKDGKCIKLIEYDEFEKIQYIHLFTYDNKGLLIQRVREEVQAKDRRTYEITYNENNLKIKELTYNFDNILLEAKYLQNAT